MWIKKQVAYSVKLGCPIDGYEKPNSNEMPLVAKRMRVPRMAYKS